MLYLLVKRAKNCIDVEGSIGWAFCNVKSSFHNVVGK